MPLFTFIIKLGLIKCKILCKIHSVTIVVSENMNKLCFASLALLVGIVAAQVAIPTVPQSLGFVSMPSVAALPIPPPGAYSSQSIQKILKSKKENFEID